MHNTTIDCCSFELTATRVLGEWRLLTWFVMELDRIGAHLSSCLLVGKWEVGNEREERFLKCLQVEPKCCVVASILDGTRWHTIPNNTGT